MHRLLVEPNHLDCAQTPARDGRDLLRRFGAAQPETQPKNLRQLAAERGGVAARTIAPTAGNG